MMQINLGDCEPLKLRQIHPVISCKSVYLILFLETWNVQPLGHTLGSYRQLDT